ncbi:MAG: hypothetical protein H0V17_35590 [Deltaproteobacteria bacterium]|nr:hypothetical protein [Deltaproteobacteria bacterium]
MKRSSKRVVKWIVGSVVAFFALTAFAHTSVGLSAIAWVTGSDGCPFGHDQKTPALTAAAAEDLRVHAITRAEHPAAEPAPARPALGFVLDTTRRAEVLAWATQHSIACRTDRSGAGIRCDHVDGAWLPSPLADIRGVASFGFDTADRLVSVTFETASTTPKARVLEVAGEAMSTLEQQLGARSLGDSLAAPAFIRRETRVAYADYVATVVASNAGKRWMSMQTFQSIPKPALAAR